MKVEKSSEACAKFNALNAEYIATGLVEAQEPSEAVLISEAKMTAERAAGIKRSETKYGILHSIWEALPENVRSQYREPKADGKDEYRPSMVAPGSFPTVTIESYGKSSRWSSRHDYYRIEVGGYGDQGRYIKLNHDLTITPAQVAKVAAKIVDRFHEAVAKSNLRSKREEAMRLRDAWLKDEANNKLAQIILDTGYVGYGDKVSITEDARVTLGYETLTVAQWREVAALKLEQRAAMKALKDSFKPATATVNS